MSDEPIVLARADSLSSARSVPWGAAAPDGSTSYSDHRDRVRFDRRELKRILDLYGAMVMAGEWRDYAIDFRSDVAVFSIFRRTSSWIPWPLVHRDEVDVGLILDQRLSAVAMVDVPVDDEDPLQTVLLARVVCGERDVPKEAESHRSIIDGVVSWRAHGGEAPRMDVGDGEIDG